MKTTKKKRNPNDSTFRNINALKKRVAELEKALKYHDKAIKICYFELQRLSKEPQP